MKIRRCAVLYIEPREDLAIDWQSLFAGQRTLSATLSWRALAPHLDREFELGEAELALLGGVGQTLWSERADCEQRFGAAPVARLLELGLLIGDDDDHAATRARDDLLRAHHWHPLAALVHTFSRWQDVRAETGMQAPSFQELLDRNGPPPPPSFDLPASGAAVALPPVAYGSLDDTLFKRYTGRNYDTRASLPATVMARLLQRTFGAQEVRTVGPHAEVLKKTSPGGGGLHPTEAFVLVQRVDGVAPGLYHYHPIAHELRPLRTMTHEAAAALALQMMAEQDWLANAPIQVVLVARVERSFWKYRNHQKAYRVLSLDAGHLSQTFYLLAAEAGLPAFITAAVNDTDIEQMLGLDHLRHVILGVCGCGPAADGERSMAELRYGETDAI